VDLVLQQPQVSSVDWKLLQWVGTIDVPMEVASDVLSSRVEGLETRTGSNPVDSSYWQPVVVAMVETLNMFT